MNRPYASGEFHPSFLYQYTLYFQWCLHSYLLYLYIADVVANLKNQVPKTTAVKILATLAGRYYAVQLVIYLRWLVIWEKGQLTVKTYGKQLLYLYNQASTSPGQAPCFTLIKYIVLVERFGQRRTIIIRWTNQEFSIRAWRGKEIITASSMWYAEYHWLVFALNKRSRARFQNGITKDHRAGKGDWTGQIRGWYTNSSCPMATELTFSSIRIASLSALWFHFVARRKANRPSRPCPLKISRGSTKILCGGEKNGLTVARFTKS